MLCLPVLLFVTTLMFNAESNMCWKVRGDVTARDAAWRSRWRSGGNLPNPVNWPPPATMGAGGMAPNARLDLAALQHPVVRGPQIGTFVVDSTKLDNTRGGWLGQSHRGWTPPLMPKLARANIDSQHSIWDTEWQYWQMGIPYNTYRRIPYLYQLPQPDPSLEALYMLALAAIVNSPAAPYLTVLDHDEELHAWYVNYVDFHPRVRDFCDANRMRVAQNQVQALVNQIQGGTPPRPRNGVPGRMANTFLNMYRAQLQAGVNPAAAAQISALEQFLSQL